jgi:hypothetical protein
MKLLDVAKVVKNTITPTSQSGKTDDGGAADFLNDMMEQQVQKMLAANKAAILKMADKMKESAAEDEDGDE